MRLQPVTPANERQSVMCCDCNETGDFPPFDAQTRRWARTSPMVPTTHAFADLDGPAFAAYYCAPHAERRLAGAAS